jgi:ABC-type transporter Mla subunit MlaD
MDQNVKVRVQGEGVEGFTGAMDSAIGSLMSFKGAVGAVGGALAALSAGALMNAVNAARSFETAMVEVEKVTDPETAAAMSEEIRNMAETIPLAQEELAGLAADAARFGIRGPENLRKFSESVAKMATATDLSTDEAGQALAKLSELTNTPVDQIENLGSVINELSNTAATSSSEITDSMLRSSAALSQLGLNQTQIAAMSASLNEVSASSRRAGTRLRRVAQASTPQGPRRGARHDRGRVRDHARRVAERVNDANGRGVLRGRRESRRPAELALDREPTGDSRPRAEHRGAKRGARDG